MSEWKKKGFLGKKASLRVFLPLSPSSLSPRACFFPRNVEKLLWGFQPWLEKRLLCKFPCSRSGFHRDNLPTESSGPSQTHTFPMGALVTPGVPRGGSCSEGLPSIRVSILTPPFLPFQAEYSQNIPPFLIRETEGSLAPDLFCRQWLLLPMASKSPYQQLLKAKKSHQDEDFTHFLYYNYFFFFFPKKSVEISFAGLILKFEIFKISIIFFSPKRRVEISSAGFASSGRRILTMLCFPLDSTPHQELL